MPGLALVDIPRSGAANMAIDQLLLEEAVRLNRPMVRVYQWAEPTVSLGYFQKYADFQQHPCFVAPDAVRRATGGGAIVHDFDWTYALALPTASAPATGPAAQSSAIGAAMPVYDCIHDSVVAWLRELGWNASKWSEAPGAVVPPAERKGKSADFLCFARRSQGDVVVDGAKIMGSAQRRIRGGLLQHGSLLLKRSPLAESLPGLYDLKGGCGLEVADMLLAQPTPALLLEILRAAIAALLAVDFVQTSEIFDARALEGHLGKKFASTAYLERV